MSTLTRRGFFGSLAAVVVGAVAAFKAKSKPRRSISLRYVAQYDIATDRWPQRLDCWYLDPDEATLAKGERLLNMRFKGAQ
jgi:hypothetical protein